MVQRYGKLSVMGAGNVLGTLPYKVVHMSINREKGIAGAKE